MLTPPPLPNDPRLSQPIWSPAGKNLGLVETNVDNTSGTDGPIPPEIASLKFNHGGFGYSILWLMSHHLWAASIALIAIPFVTAFLILKVSHLFAMVGYGLFAVDLYLGFVGHRLARRHRRFKSLDHYFKIQGIWTAWAIGTIVWASH